MNRELHDEILDFIHEWLHSHSKEVTLPAGALATCDLAIDASLDSLDVVALLFDLEDKFRIEIPTADVDAQELLLVPNLLAYVTAKFQ